MHKNRACIQDGNTAKPIESETGMARQIQKWERREGSPERGGRAPGKRTRPGYGLDREEKKKVSPPWAARLKCTNHWPGTRPQGPPRTLQAGNPPAKNALKAAQTCVPKGTQEERQEQGRDKGYG